MTVFTSHSSGYQAVRFHSRRNRPRVAVHQDLEELPSASRFARNPTCRTWRYVAFHALQLRVRRVLVCYKLRPHDVTRLAAELWGFHVIHRPVCDLSSNNHVKKGCKSEKPGQTFNCSLSIKDRFLDLPPEAVFPKVNAEGNQR